MNGQSVTNNRICGGNVMSQAKIFKLLSEAYGLTWSGGIAAEEIDGCHSCSCIVPILCSSIDVDSEAYSRIYVWRVFSTSPHRSYSVHHFWIILII